MVLEDDCITETSSALMKQRNLQAWSVSIPSISFSEDVVKREKIPVFSLEVERNDRKNSEHLFPLSSIRVNSDVLTSFPPLHQWVMKLSGGGLTGGTWSSTFWNPDLLSSTVKINLK